MNIRWSPLATSDYTGQVEYLTRVSLSAAEKFASAIYDAIDLLETMPRMGRMGEIADTRELVIGQHVVVYRLSSDLIEILRVYHAKQNWQQ